MSYKQERFRETLRGRVHRQAIRAGEIRSNETDAPRTTNPKPVNDITGYGYLGFAWTGGDAGGFNTNPEGEA